MKVNSFRAKRKAPVYKDITNRFRRQYSSAFDSLVDHGHTLQKNRQLAAEIRAARHYALANKVQACGRQMVGNDPNDLRQSHYCRNPYWCLNCSTILAQHRAAQLMEACEQFTHHCRRAELVYHSFLLKPEVAGVFGSDAYGEGDAKGGLRLLQAFKVNLRKYHNKHNYRMLADDPGYRKLPERNKHVWGPTVSAIHVSPARQGLFKRVERSSAHLHFVIVTPREGGKRALTQTVKELWTKTKWRFDTKYLTNVEELTRTRQRAERREDGETAAGRLGHFWPGCERGLDYVAAMKTFVYLSQPIKSHWAASAIADNRWITEEAGYGPKDLHQRLGMMGVRCNAVPHSFSPEQLRQRFIATYHDKSCEELGKWSVAIRRSARINPGAAAHK